MDNLAKRPECNITNYKTIVTSIELVKDYHELRVKNPPEIGTGNSNKIKITSGDLEYLIERCRCKPVIGKPFTLIGRQVIAFYDNTHLIAIIPNLE
jgi:hypothetical protein